MKLRIDIELGNDAMRFRGHAAEAIASALLRQPWETPLCDGDDGVILDENGNRVGTRQVDEDIRLPGLGEIAAAEGVS